ncbi:MAG: hypothetical protein AAB590_00655 [Patescibacteria group bacterium]
MDKINEREPLLPFDEGDESIELADQESHKEIPKDAEVKGTVFRNLIESECQYCGDTNPKCMYCKGRNVGK